MKKYRIDIYASWNADMLISRNYVCFMEVVNVKADYNKLRIWVVIPEGVWKAWKDYSDRYYTEGR